MLGSKSYSDAMHQYAELLLVLHHLIRDGKGDTDEADEVRDQMDGPWHEMTSHEISITDGLSADLYSIGMIHPRNTKSLSSENAIFLSKLIESNDWAAALTFLREIESPDYFYDIASIRGFIWFEMGFPKVAYEFLNSLSEISNLGVSRELLFLKVCELTKNYDTGMHRALRYDKNSHPMLWFASFRIVSLRADSESNDESKLQLLGFANALGLRCISLFENEIADPEFIVVSKDARQILIYTHIQLAINFAQLGVLESAKTHLKTALTLDPVNLSAFDLLKEIEIKEKSTNPISATREFTNYGSRLPLIDIQSNLLVPTAFQLN